MSCGLQKRIQLVQDMSYNDLRDTLRPALGIRGESHEEVSSMMFSTNRPQYIVPRVLCTVRTYSISGAPRLKSQLLCS